MKEFSKWTIEEVEETFHLQEVEQSQWLTAWQTAEMLVTPDEETRLRELCAFLGHHVLDWNEEELKIKFIGPLMLLVNYEHPTYQAFFERRLSVVLDQERLAGVVDCVIARGKRSPKHPVFCLQQYRPKPRKSPDPFGQVMVAMVAARLLNQDDKPVYGAYVMGRNWFFVVLHGASHAVSLAYDATKDDDLRQIFKMLKYIKQMIEQELQGGMVSITTDNTINAPGGQKS